MSAATSSIREAMTIPKALSLINSKHSSEMVERHVRALNRIASSFKRGVPLKDLPQLCQLLRVAAEKMKTHILYEEPICKIVATCSLPFLKERSSDENTYAPCIIETLSLLGSLMIGLESEALRQHVAQTVADFYLAESNEAKAEGLQATAVTYNAALLEQSGVVHYLAEALKLTQDPYTKLTILRALQTLSVSGTNCNHILAAKACGAICSTISDTSTEIALVGLEVLWNILEHGPQLQVAEQMTSLGSVCPLHDAVRRQVASSSHTDSKQLRNDLLALVSLVAKISPDAPFIETGFLHTLCSYFLSFEVASVSSRHELGPSRGGSTGGERAGKAAKVDEEDFELVKTLMVTLTSLSCDQGTIKVLCEQKVMRGLLSFVVRNDHSPSNYSSAHFEELQLLALSCLCTLGPLCLEQYMVCQGNTRLLLILEWCHSSPSEFKGHGNAFHGRGGWGGSLAQLRMSVRALLSVCRTRDEVALQDLHDQGAIPLLIGILKSLSGTVGEGGSQRTGPDSGLLLELQSDILVTISCLCETDIHRKELFGGYDGVKLLTGYLRGADQSGVASGLGRHRLLLAATDCVWCTVVGSPVVEDIFLEEGGIFCLLDLLQVCPLNNQSLVLGVLVDLCENPKAIPHLAAWRGRERDMCAWSLLASLWRQEETEMGVPRTDTGALAGTSNPLVGQEQEKCGVPPIPSHQPSAAVIDITENMRAKIYILCCKMGFQYVADDLTTEDKITLCIIRNYLDFKSGEVWYEVAGELAQEGLRPVTPDQEALQEVLHSHEEKAENSLRLQSELIEEQHRYDLEEEQQYFEKIHQLHYMEEKAKADFTDFVNRTSNYKALKEAKRRQREAIDASRRSSVAIGDHYHKIDQDGVTVTVSSFSGTPLTIYIP
ncbi:Cilia- and flagella-associated protein 69 [Geodia barretti]|uniref:Cilia- and flagella-associated protein 69 n=1 Tax=Geodia barretti TaxID=519541 RepID=A0AA35W8A0_GEOBA|nr:Cilia- and flagella-associated protein 69 [Geodia barretti]